MTARVLNPVALTEFTKLRSPSIRSMSRNLPCGAQMNRIKRDLFGPANPTETTKIFNDELEKHQEKATKKWGFDFRNGSPLISGNTQFIWEHVPFTDFIPEMYTLTRAAHVRETPDATEYDALMDERADRENLSSSSTVEDDSCDDSQDESLVVFKAPAASAAPSTVAASSRTLRKRQPKITEYMKERKRLAQTPKKISPVKRARTTSSSSTSSLLNSLRNLQRNH